MERNTSVFKERGVTLSVISNSRSTRSNICKEMLVFGHCAIKRKFDASTRYEILMMQDLCIQFSRLIDHHDNLIIIIIFLISCVTYTYATWSVFSRTVFSFKRSTGVI